MTYLLILILLAAVVGVGAWFASKAAEPSDEFRDGGADQAVTSTDAKPPAHPDQPVPGSDTARHRADQP